MSARILVAALLVGTAASAQAATLRPMTTLRGPVVKLSDLWDEAGKQADRVLGPGPAPGQRIVVESRQLGAIAREFGVDWKPQGDGERAVLDRPGRLLTREEMMPPLKEALVSAGMAEDATIDVPAFEPPVVPADGAQVPVVTRVDYEAATGRFTAQLSLSVGGTEPLAWRVSGRAMAMLAVPVPVTRLLPGAVLSAADLHVVKLPAGRVPSGAVREADQAVGKQLRYQAAPELPLLLSALTAPALVKRNARVVILADSPGLSLSLEGRALEGGGEGDHVRVLNPSSHAVLDAVVIGTARVRVDPTAPPIETARTGAGTTEYGR